MALYEYKCDKCEQVFEVLRKSTDTSPVACPSCHSPEVNRTLSTGTGFILKGYGWHKSGFH